MRLAEREGFGFGRESPTRFANTIGLGRSGADAGETARAFRFRDGVTAETAPPASQRDGIAVSEVTGHRLGRITLRRGNDPVWR